MFMLMIRLACVLMLAVLCSAQDDFFLFRKKLAVMTPFLWPASLEQATQIRREDVVRLVQDLYPEDSVKTVFAVETFRFAPLEKGKLYLLVVTDVTGRGFFNSIEVIRCPDRRECTMTSWGSEGPNNLDDVQLVDVDANGTIAIVTRDLAGGYEGADTRPVFIYSIRKLVGSELVDVSGKYSKYFREHIVPRMDADKQEVLGLIKSKEREAEESAVTVAAAGATGLYKWRTRTMAELQFADDDYHRRVLGEKDAGLENALRWTRAADIGAADIGVMALEQIESHVATDELKRLASSSEPLSREARDALVRRTDRLQRQHDQKK